jgi:hypothetical protein
MASNITNLTPNISGTDYSIIFRFKKDPKTETWLLNWADRNNKWREYPPLPFHARIEKLLDEVEKNENGAFWG